MIAGSPFSPPSPVEGNLYEPSRGKRLHLFAINNELWVESGGVRQRLEAQQTTQSLQTA
jgi:hypothetical protein